MSDIATDLVSKRCKSSISGVERLGPADIARLLPSLDGWSEREGRIAKTFRFPDYWHTIAFVNATAWISQREDHHPDLQVGYNECRVEYHTHVLQGLSENDFICAAKLDALFAL